MNVVFADTNLDRLETDPAFTAGWPVSVVKAFRRRIQAIRDAKDERDLRQMRSWHYEKLKGDRSHQRSIRLNQQWRLILEITDDDGEKAVRVCSIEDYH